ncbi:DDE-type integrase/transposase/recombinase [Streptomyces sp. NPDC058424]|uniref:DDE-type integrase/transposase/recombinase n=1 Tax=Streptomyces sp. NPDC058424 TaxID=3346491 RepID=UPI003669AC31
MLDVAGPDGGRQPRTSCVATSLPTPPDQVWCGYMTEIETGEGKLYLASVIDLFSRRLLDYAMGERHDSELVVALHMAVATRGDGRHGLDQEDQCGPSPWSSACSLSPPSLPSSTWPTRASSKCARNAASDATT